MNRSDSINELAAALAKAQGAMVSVGKGNRANIATKAGGSYSYAYADLADVCDMIRKPLADNGLAILQSPVVTDRSVEVETVLAHISGQWVSATVAMWIADHDPKAVGSAITYGRRYGMCLLGVVTGDDDDDGDRANGHKPAATQAQRQAAPPTQPTGAQAATPALITEAQWRGLVQNAKPVMDHAAVLKLAAETYHVAKASELTAAQYEDLANRVDVMLKAAAVPAPAVAA